MPASEDFTPLDTLKRYRHRTTAMIDGPDCRWRRLPQRRSSHVTQVRTEQPVHMVNITSGGYRDDAMGLVRHCRCRAARLLGAGRSGPITPRRMTSTSSIFQDRHWRGRAGLRPRAVFRREPGGERAGRTVLEPVYGTVSVAEKRSRRFLTYAGFDRDKLSTSQRYHQVRELEQRVTMMLIPSPDTARVAGNIIELLQQPECEHRQARRPAHLRGQHQRRPGAYAGLGQAVAPSIAYSNVEGAGMNPRNGNEF